MTDLVYEKGKIIMEEGELGGSAYLLKSGRVEVSNKIEGKRVVLAVVEAEQILGGDESRR